MKDHESLKQPDCKEPVHQINEDQPKESEKYEYEEIPVLQSCSASNPDEHIYEYVDPKTFLTSKDTTDVSRESPQEDVYGDVQVDEYEDLNVAESHSKQTDGNNEYDHLSGKRSDERLPNEHVEDVSYDTLFTDNKALLTDNEAIYEPLNDEQNSKYQCLSEEAAI